MKTLACRDELIAFVAKVQSQLDDRALFQISHSCSVTLGSDTPQEVTYAGIVTLQCGCGYFSGVCVAFDLGDPIGPGMDAAGKKLSRRKDGLSPEQAVDIFLTSNIEGMK